MALVEDISITIDPWDVVTVAHNIRDDSGPLTPHEVIADRATTIRVIAITSADITFENNHYVAATAVFRCKRYHTTEAPPGTLPFGSQDSPPSKSMSFHSFSTDYDEDHTAVHAAYADNLANVFAGPISDPDIPRGITVTIGFGWGGGDVTIYGTDFNDQPCQETVADGPPNTYYTASCFKTVTSIEKALVGGGFGTVSVGCYAKIGLPSSAYNGIVLGWKDTGAFVHQEPSQFFLGDPPSAGVMPFAVLNELMHYKAIYTS